MLKSEIEVRDRFVVDGVRVRDNNGDRYMINRKGKIERRSVSEEREMLFPAVIKLTLIIGTVVSTVFMLLGAGFVTTVVPAFIFCFVFFLLVGLNLPLDEYSIDADLDGVSRLENIQFGSPKVKKDSSRGIEGYKKAYLLGDSIKFKYELVDLKNSKPNELVYNIDEGLTLKEVKEKDDIKFKAMELYIKNEILDDEKINQLIETYNEILQYQEDKKVQDQYQRFLDNKGETVFNLLETSKQEIIKDISNLRDSGKSYIEENQKIIERIKSPVGNNK